ncbi:MAG TPA: hypothetical protein VEW48_01960 [Thermoanaerobaculia bacterium]|nr:hypothetical protein [Thermoanaerobaculia bacterium]
MRRQNVLFTLLLILPLAARLAAQPLTAGPKTPVSAGYGDGQAVASGSDGGFAFFWMREDFSLAVRAFTPAGSPAGPEHTLFVPRTIPADILITVSANHWDVAAHPGGGYVAVWEELTNADQSFSSIFRAQRLDASGQPSGAPTTLEQAAGFYPFSIKVNPAGGLTLLSGEGFLVFAQRFDANGAKKAAFNLVYDLILKIDSGSAIVPGGGFVVATSEAGAEIQVRRLQPDGTPAGPTVPVDEPGRPVTRSRLLVAAGPSGHFVVAWKEAGSLPQAGRRIMARLFGPDGQPLGPGIVLASPAANVAHDLHDVAVRTDGSFLIQWTLGPDLLASAFDANSGRIAPDLLLDHSPIDAGFATDLAATPGGWISTWSTYSETDGGSGPWFRFLTLPCGGSPDAPGLCLNADRFRATVVWRIPGSGAQGTGMPVPRTSDTGAFWFFQPPNVELVLKVLDGRGLNGHFWVFYGSLTNVEFDLTVTDTVTGKQRTYHNPAGTMASRADTAAF